MLFHEIDQVLLHGMRYERISRRSRNRKNAELGRKVNVMAIHSAASGGATRDKHEEVS